MNKHRCHPAFLPACLVVLAASSAHADLIAHWKFDDGSGTTAVDSAGSSDGTLAGSPTWVTGTVDGALDFDGATTGDVVQAAVAGLPTGNAARTVSLWLNADATATDQKFFSYGNGTVTDVGSAFSWTLESVSGTPTVFFRHIGGNRQFTGTGVTLGAWTHVAMVVPDGATTVGDVLLYLNGALVTGTSGTVTLNTLSTDVVIGGRGTVYTVTNDFDGTIDDVQIYNTALSSTDVQSLFNNPGSVITFSTPKITSITSVGGGMWEVTLAGAGTTGYEFRSSTTLEFIPGTLVQPLIDAGGPGTIGGPGSSVVTTDESGAAKVQMSLSGTRNFVRAASIP